MGQAIVDWSLIENKDVVRIVQQEARKVVRQYEGVIEVDDLTQEGYIAIAMRPHIVKNYLAGGDLGFLSRWVWQRMTDVARKENTAHQRTTSFEALELE